MPTIERPTIECWQTKVRHCWSLIDHNSVKVTNEVISDLHVAPDNITVYHIYTHMPRTNNEIHSEHSLTSTADLTARHIAGCCHLANLMAEPLTIYSDSFMTTVWYGIVVFNIPLDTLQVILETILQVVWPNQQRHGTEGRWLVKHIKKQSPQAQLTKR